MSRRAAAARSKTGPSPDPPSLLRRASDRGSEENFEEAADSRSSELDITRVMGDDMHGSAGTGQKSRRGQVR
jgi:hypothetical protein